MAYRAPGFERRDEPIELPIVRLGLPMRSLVAAACFTSLGLLFLMVLLLTELSWMALIIVVGSLCIGARCFLHIFRATTSLKITYHPSENRLVVVERSIVRDINEQFHDLEGLRDVVLEESGRDNWHGGFNYGRLPRWRLGLDYVTGDFDFRPLTDDHHYRKRSQQRAQQELIRLLLSDNERRQVR